MPPTTFNEDYTNTFNAIAAMMQGSTSRDNVAMAAFVLAAFKRLVDWVVAHQEVPLPAARLAGIPANPFDVTTK